MERRTLKEEPQNFESATQKPRAPAYSLALRRIKGVVQRVVHVKLRFDFQRSGDVIHLNLPVRWRKRKEVSADGRH